MNTTHPGTDDPEPPGPGRAARGGRRPMRAGRAAGHGAAHRRIVLADQFAGPRLAAAGLIAASTTGLALTEAGRAAIGIG